MASELSDIAKRMLVDPEWARLFKLNVEILSDSLHYGFLALATLALAIKFTEHFGAGSINCFLTGAWEISTLEVSKC